MVQVLDVRFLEHSQQDFQVIEQLCTSHELRADVGHWGILIQVGVCCFHFGWLLFTIKASRPENSQVFRCDICMNAAIIELFE